MNTMYLIAREDPKEVVEMMKELQRRQGRGRRKGGREGR